jgi:hypothetical protein
MGLRIPGLAENRELLAPRGTMQQSATRLLRLMHEQGLLRRAGNLPPQLPNDLFDTRFLPGTLGMAP